MRANHLNHYTVQCHPSCTYCLVAPKHAQEPHSARDRNTVRMQKIQEVVALRTVRNILPELVQRDFGVREVSKPCLTLRIVQRHSRWHPKRRGPAFCRSRVRYLSLRFDHKSLRYLSSALRLPRKYLIHEILQIADRILVQELRLDIIRRTPRLRLHAYIKSSATPASSSRPGGAYAKRTGTASGAVSPCLRFVSVRTSSSWSGRGGKKPTYPTTTDQPTPRQPRATRPTKKKDTHPNPRPSVPWGATTAAAARI